MAYAIADAAHCANQRAVEAKIDLAPQVVDVDIHDVGHCVEIQLPHLPDDCGS